MNTKSRFAHKFSSILNLFLYKGSNYKTEYLANSVVAKRWSMPFTFVQITGEKFTHKNRNLNYFVLLLVYEGLVVVAEAKIMDTDLAFLIELYMKSPTCIYIG